MKDIIRKVLREEFDFSFTDEIGSGDVIDGTELTHGKKFYIEYATGDSLVELENYFKNYNNTVFETDGQGVLFSCLPEHGNLVTNFNMCSSGEADVFIMPNGNINKGEWVYANDMTVSLITP